MPRFGLGSLLALALATGLTAGCSGEAEDRRFDYVAIGDSYASAPGVPLTQRANGCLRSDHNFPTLVAAARPQVRLIDNTCAGATTANVTQPQELVGFSHAPQLDGVSAATDLVTIRLGVNDNNLFITMFGRCPEVRSLDPLGSPCRLDPGPSGAAATTPLLQELPRRLTKVVQAVSAKAPDATIVLVGYPSWAPATGSCPDRLPLAEGDLQYLRDLAVILNGSIRQVAETTNSHFVDAEALSRGHDICSLDPWVAGAIAWADANTFHPRPAEQIAIAQAIGEIIGAD